MKLLLNGLIKLISGFLIMGLILFGCAGSLSYSGGWLFLLLLFFPMLILGAVLFIKAPDLLKKRLDTKEKEKTQKKVVALSAVVFLSGFTIAGLDFRFGWSSLPLWVTLLSSILFLLSYMLYAEVMRENAYLSRTVKVEENQKIIDTGLYALVRHPMYMATVIMFLSIPLILGSLYSFIVFLLYPVIITLRIKNEEKFLEENLEGYKEYKEKTKYRLLPFVW